MLKNKYLFVVFCIALLLYYLQKTFFVETVIRTDSAQMEAASKQAARWFELITEIKKEKGLLSEEGKSLKYGGLSGLEYSETTTTLGSLDAKITAMNPDFAALTMRWLDDLKVDSTKTVGVILSGSFPSLSICALAALQQVNAKTVIISSLGASSYGANDPQATWIDLENWLRSKGGLKYKSDIVSLGAEDDNGGGLVDEGVEMLKKAAARNNTTLFIPKEYNESFQVKKKLLAAKKIDLLINIGGNQVSMGACVHGISIPNGMHKNIKCCTDKDRGLIFEFAEHGVPIIHFLNIKSLASAYGLPIMPKQYFEKSEILYQDKQESRLFLIFSIALITFMLFLFKYKPNKTIQTK